MENTLSDKDYEVVLNNPNVPIHAQIVYFKLMLHGLCGFDPDMRRIFGGSMVVMQWLQKNGEVIVRSDRNDSPHKAWFDEFNKWC